MPTLQAAGVFSTTNSASPQTITIPGGYTTALNDCIVVSFSLGNNFGAAFFTGAGATWVNFNVDVNNTAGMAVGYGCSAGQTTFACSYHANQIEMFAIGVWSGIGFASSPISGSSQNTGGGSLITSLGSGLVSYSAGELLLAGGQTEFQVTPTHAPTVSSWSNGGSNTNIAAGTDASNIEGASLDMGSSASGSSTSVTYGASGNSKMRATVLAIGVVAGTVQVMIV